LLLAVIKASVDPSIGRRPVVGHSPPIDDPGIDGWKAGSLAWSDEDGWTIPDTRRRHSIELSLEDETVRGLRAALERAVRERERSPVDSLAGS
jgi:hypothetical protein